MGNCMNNPADPFAALDRSIEKAAESARLESQIYSRVRSLMREKGLEYDYSEEEALKQAVAEATGVDPR